MRANREHDGITSTVTTFVKKVAHRLVRRAGLTRSDVDDLVQEMLLDLLKRLPKFNPEKSSHEKFCIAVVRHKVATILRDRNRARRNSGCGECSLNQDIVGERGMLTQRVETLSRQDVEGRTGIRERVGQEQRELSMDLAAALNGLPQDLLAVAQELKSQTVAGAARKLGISRSTVYDRIHKLRKHLKDAGLHEYL